MEEYIPSIFRVSELGSGRFWIFSHQQPPDCNSVTLKMDAAPPLKCWNRLIILHGVIPQKTINWVNICCTSLRSLSVVQCVP